MSSHSASSGPHPETPPPQPEQIPMANFAFNNPAYPTEFPMWPGQPGSTLQPQPQLQLPLQLQQQQQFQPQPQPQPQYIYSPEVSNLVGSGYTLDGGNNDLLPQQCDQTAYPQAPNPTTYNPLNSASELSNASWSAESGWTTSSGLSSDQLGNVNSLPPPAYTYGPQAQHAGATFAFGPTYVQYQIPQVQLAGVPSSSAMAYAQPQTTQGHRGRVPKQRQDNRYGPYKSQGRREAPSATSTNHHYAPQIPQNQWEGQHLNSNSDSSFGLSPPMGEVPVMLGSRYAKEPSGVPNISGRGSQMIKLEPSPVPNLSKKRGRKIKKEPSPLASSPSPEPTPAKKRKGTKRKQDTDADDKPKMAPNAFMLYRCRLCKYLEHEGTYGMVHNEATAVVSRLWHMIGEKGQKPYRDQYKRKEPYVPTVVQEGEDPFEVVKLVEVIEALGIEARAAMDPSADPHLDSLRRQRGRFRKQDPERVMNFLNIRKRLWEAYQLREGITDPVPAVLTPGQLAKVEEDARKNEPFSD